MKQIFLTLSLLLFSHCIQADVYKCVDEAGKTRYQASPCAGVVIKIEEWQPVPDVGKARDFVSKPLSSHHAKRSVAAKNLFKSFHPCPATGEDRGPCPGYVVDHIKPLACGGADDPRNMQWQTVAAGKDKDGWERIGCQGTARFGSRDIDGGVRRGKRGGRYSLGPSGRGHYLTGESW